MIPSVLTNVRAVVCRLGLALALISCASPVPGYADSLGGPQNGTVIRVAPRQANPSAQIRFRFAQRTITSALDRGDLAAAIAAAEKQHRAFPKELKASTDLGLLYLRASDYVRAEPLLRGAIRQQNTLAPGHDRLLLGQVYTALGQIELDTGRLKQAIATLQQAVGLDSTQPRARFLLAIAYYETGDERRGARENTIAFGFDPKSAMARPKNFQLLAHSQLRSGRTAEAAATLERAVATLQHAPGLHYELATLARRQGRSAEALLQLLHEQMLERSGSANAQRVHDEVAALRAEAATSSDESLRSFVAVLDLRDAEQDEDALQALHRAIRRLGSEPLVVQLLLAEQYIATGRYGEAERLLTKILDERPMCLPALTTLAKLCLKQGRPNMAGGLLERALGIDRHNLRLQAVLEARGL